MEQLLLTVAEVAASLRLSRNKVYELLYSEQLASVKIGGARRVPASAVRAFVDRLSSPDRAA